MKKVKQVLLALIILLVATALVGAEFVQAKSCGGQETLIFSCPDDAEGADLFLTPLAAVLNVMTIGVGVLATVGIVWSGIIYLTARDNEALVVKAKRRLIEIGIGLVVYTVMFSFLSFVIPGGIFNDLIGGSGGAEETASESAPEAGGESGEMQAMSVGGVIPVDSTEGSSTATIPTIKHNFNQAGKWIFVNNPETLADDSWLADGNLGNRLFYKDTFNGNVEIYWEHGLSEEGAGGL